MKKDTNKRTFALLRSQTIFIHDEINGEGYSEALKFSACYNTTLVGSGQKIYGGDEDCLDAVRGEEYTIKNFKFVPQYGTKQTITMKGGIENIVFEDCEFNKQLVFGQYSDYDMHGPRKTKNIRFINCKFYNSPVVLWNAENVEFINCEGQKIIKVNPSIVKIYYTYRIIKDFIEYGIQGRSGKWDHGII